MGKVHIVVGDLLDSDCTIIGHQANCQKTMGAGLAKQIKERYPEAHSADLVESRSPEYRLGGFSSAYITREERYVFNLYGQLKYGRDPNVVYTDIKALRKAVWHMFEHASPRYYPGAVIKVGLPHGIGAGLANGSWNDIYEMLKQLIHSRPFDLYLYSLVPLIDVEGLPYRVVVAGGRDFADMALLTTKLDALLAQRIADGYDVIIVSGTARGADKLGEAYAELRGLKVESHPADWDKHGKKAGYIRNAEMADVSDALVAFYDGVSKGTTHMLNIAKNKELPYRVIAY